MDFTTFVMDKFQELANKFRKKHDQYKSEVLRDELANFRAYVETHGIEGLTVEDSLEDIAIYAVIMLYMRHCYDEQVKGENNDGK